MRLRPGSAPQGGSELSVRVVGGLAVLLAASAIWVSSVEIPSGSAAPHDCVPILLALELPEDVEELRTLVKAVTLAGGDSGLRESLSADRLLILSYWLFLCGSGWVTSRQPFRRATALGWLSLGVATTAALADFAENSLIGASFRMPAPELSGALAFDLRLAASTKWLSFYLAAGLASAPFLIRTSNWLRFVGACFALATVAGVLTLIDRRAALLGYLPLLAAIPGAAVAYLFSPARFLQSRG